MSLSFLLNTWSFTFNDFCSPLASTKITISLACTSTVGKLWTFCWFKYQPTYPVLFACTVNYEWSAHISIHIKCVHLSISLNTLSCLLVQEYHECSVHWRIGLKCVHLSISLHTQSCLLVQAQFENFECSAPNLTSTNRRFNLIKLFLISSSTVRTNKLKCLSLTNFFGLV